MSTFEDIGRLQQEKYKNSFQFSQIFFGIAKICRSTRTAPLLARGAQGPLLARAQRPLEAQVNYY